MPDKKILMILAAVAAFTLAAFAGFYAPGYWQARQEREAQENFRPSDVPDEMTAAFAADFTALHKAIEPQRLPDDPFITTEGKEVRISDFSGQPVLVNFWATWCAPCVVELPALKRLADHYDGRLKVVGIALDPTKDEKAIGAFLEGRNLGDFAAYLDKNGKIGGKLGIRGLPASFLIGSDGLILYRFDGDADWTSAESKAFFDAFLTLDR